MVIAETGKVAMDVLVNGLEKNLLWGKDGLSCGAFQVPPVCHIPWIAAPGNPCKSNIFPIFPAVI
jgi:hypothetical protein